jgi:DNA-binding winged helix-turn-helix (wHTH) protein/TolB-like protein/Tfp pilus assembly protein PilF
VAGFEDCIEHASETKVPKKRRWFAESLVNPREPSVVDRRRSRVITTSDDSIGPPGPARLRIGRWEVERELNQLSTAGETLKIEPKAMAVLAHLADRRGQVVSRSSLLSNVWPHAVVGDDCLTQVVVKLRKALGDSPHHPTYIQTIAKHGYRLVAPVVHGPDPDDTAAPAPTGARPAERTGRRARWLVGAGAAGAVLAAGISWSILGPFERPATQGLTSGVVPVRLEGPTVAIRPFEALSNDPDEIILAHGITADLVTDLSKVFGLWVVGASSPGDRQHGQAPKDQDSIHYLVAGTVQRFDHRLRLQVTLSDAGSGKLLWSERFDRNVSDLFAVQDELGPKLLRVLPTKVSEAEMRRVSRRYTHSLDAYRHFQRGQLALLAREERQNEAARASFRRAIDLDADFARAHAGLALTYAAAYRNQWARDGVASLTRALEIAADAVQMDPDIPETHWVLAFVHMERRHHDLALLEAETAVRANPSYADGYGLIASIQTYLGRPADALRSLNKAMRLDQRRGQLQLMNLGRAHLFIGNLDQAQSSLEEALSRNPANLEAHVYLATLHVMRGNAGAASWEAEEVRSLRPDFSCEEWLRTYPMTDRAQQDRLVKSMATLGL